MRDSNDNPPPSKVPYQWYESVLEREYEIEMRLESALDLLREAKRMQWKSDVEYAEWLARISDFTGEE